MVFLILSSSMEKTYSYSHYQLSKFLNLLNSKPEKKISRNLTLYGHVKEGSLKKKGITAEFTIQEKGYELAVYFNGRSLLPDTFKEGAQVSVEGYYQKEKNLFISHKVLAKCASRYQSTEADFTKQNN